MTALLSIFRASVAAPEILPHLDLSGIPLKLLKRWKKDLPDDSRAALREIRQRLDSLGYFGHSIGLDSGKTPVSIRGTAGIRHMLAKTEFQGNHAFSSQELQSRAGFMYGAGFSAGNLAAGIQRILDLYENSGYPFCRIEIEELQKTEGKVIVRLEVRENREYFVHGIRFSGNAITRPAVLERELQVHSGDPFDQSAINASVRQLERLGFFSEVHPPQLLLHSGRRRLDLVFQVEEAKTVFAEGAMGYDGDPPEGSSPWSGGADMEANNLLGTGRCGSLRFRKEGGHTFFHVAYTEPWVGGFPLQATATIELETEKQSHSRLFGGAELDYRLNLFWSFQLSGEFSELADVSAETVSRTRGVGSGVTWDHLDDPDNPRQGVRLSSRALVRSRREDDSRASEWVNSGTASCAYPVWKRWVSYGEVHGENIRSPRTTLFRGERIRLGGVGSVRGYAQGQYRVRQAAWANLELRFRPEKRSRIYVFVDPGLGYWNEVLPNGFAARKEARLLGLGMGARVPTRLGMLRVDIGGNEDSGFRNLQVHVQLKAAL